MDGELRVSIQLESECFCDERLDGSRQRHARLDMSVSTARLIFWLHAKNGSIETRTGRRAPVAGRRWQRLVVVVVVWRVVVVVDEGAISRRVMSTTPSLVVVANNRQNVGNTTSRAPSIVVTSRRRKSTSVPLIGCLTSRVWPDSRR